MRGLHKKSRKQRKEIRGRSRKSNIKHILYMFICYCLKQQVGDPEIFEHAYKYE